MLRSQAMCYLSEMYTNKIDLLMVCDKSENNLVTKTYALQVCWLPCAAAPAPGTGGKGRVAGAGSGLQKGAEVLGAVQRMRRSWPRWRSRLLRPGLRQPLRGLPCALATGMFYGGMGG